jgi:predicted membrane-bound spermidine synthase
LPSLSLLTFLLITLFMLSMSVLLFELALTRIFSIVLWYDYAFMAISIAFFGLGIGSLLTHILKNKVKREQLPSKILQTTIIFAVSVPIFLVLIGHVIPPNIHFIYLFYLTSSIPFFFAGISMSLIFFAMPREVSKLYFIDLVGAAAATLMLDPLMQRLGAESVLLSAALLVIGPSLIAALVLSTPSSQKKNVLNTPVIENKIKLSGIIVLAASAILLATNTDANILAIKPGENKGLHYQLAKPSEFEHLSTQWNSFSRIDVTRQLNPQDSDDGDNNGRSRALSAIAIDADADTPVFKWNGSSADLVWLKKFMDYLPFEISNDVNNTLVIGSGGGEDVLVALAGGSKKVTAVEINPLIISRAKQFGSSAGNLYERKEVELFIDDGRRFISSSDSKYDRIVIKLVDSWAAQLAGGYALSENYLYTVEAFRQYLRHLDEDNGMLVMVRWNFELPRLMPLVAESLRQEKKGGSSEDIRKQILVVENRPGLYFESNDKQTIYPVLLMIKNNPFTDSEINLAKERIANNNARVIVMPGGYIQPPYDTLLLDKNYYHSQKLQESDVRAILELKPPTDDSPFYFAKEQVPNQMILLLETVLGVSAVLALLLIYYSRRNRALTITSSTSSWFHMIFVIFIGLGFMFLEITFIQKFLLLLGTPIMALTVILFSILLSSGIGAYLSGKLFHKNPYKAVVVSIPLLVGIVLAYYALLQGIIDSSIIMQLPQRILLTFALLSPAGLLMGFQFPSITRMASMYSSQGEHTDENITLLWGINVIASVIATVLTAISSMVIGFNGNLLLGAGLYLGALVSAIAAAKLRQKLTLST